jgi:cellulose synthase (UDP-forming)
MEPVTIVPLALVAIFALACPDRLKDHRIARYAVAGSLGLLFLRYITWRVPVTVLPANQLDIQSALVWILFGIEVFAWLDAAILFAALCRRTSRSGEADAHEARLRRMAPGNLPAIDVFITTYNEPFEVLERTIGPRRSTGRPGNSISGFWTTASVTGSRPIAPSAGPAI